MHRVRQRSVVGKTVLHDRPCRCKNYTNVALRPIAMGMVSPPLLPPASPCKPTAVPPPKERRCPPSIITPPCCIKMSVIVCESAFEEKHTTEVRRVEVVVGVASDDGCDLDHGR